MSNLFEGILATAAAMAASQDTRPDEGLYNRVTLNQGNPKPCLCQISSEEGKAAAVRAASQDTTFW